MIGKTISHYKILEELGRGGMGEVYLAEDLKLERKVAIKFLPGHLTKNKENIERFEREARAAASLNHPNIVTIYEIAEEENPATSDRQTFIVMEYVEGKSLRDVLNEYHLGQDKIIDIFTQIGEGLSKAHDAGIVHRDIKPENIIVGKDARVRILDFGLAKLKGVSKLTKDSSTLGTIHYMSPEQIRGEEVDFRSDIWSLGVVLYEMLTGDVPFKGEYEQAIGYSILNESPKAVAELDKDAPSKLQPIIKKCLQKDPQLRYQNIQELITDLQYVTSYSRANDFSELSKQKRRRKRIVTFVVSSIAVVTLAVILIYVVIPAMKQTASESKRITLVVLPFENLGEADHTYFTEGITDEITGRLGTVNSIAVISRNSAEHYAGKTWNTKQVGKDLNVEYIVAGTVRWAVSAKDKDRVRITPRLIQVSDDTELWAESYDRVIDDVFDIQSEIAVKVVEQLGITLKRAEQITVEAKPTKNLEAYQAFLQGQYYARSPHFTVENWKRVIQSYERAVELDPEFAIAYARLASAHARLRFLRHDLSKERLVNAEIAAKKAEKLAPESEEVLLALGYYHLWAHRDIEQALKSWTLAERIIPNDPRILVAKANVYETQGNWDEAIRAVEKAIKFSPRDASMLTDLALYFWWKRNYSHAVELCNQAISLAPNENWPYLYKAFTLWSWKGANDESKHAIEAVHSDYHWIPWAWFWQDVGERQYTRALKRLDVYDHDWIRNKMWAMPRSMMQGMVYDYMGERVYALSKYQEALVLLKTEVEKWPEDPRYHSSLGLVYARLGFNDEALYEGKKATDLLPLSKDAAYGISYAEDLARIYILIGDEDSALDQIEMLFNIHSWMSVNWIKMCPLYDQLDHNSRFQDLMKKYDR